MHGVCYHMIIFMSLTSLFLRWILKWLWRCALIIGLWKDQYQPIAGRDEHHTTASDDTQGPAHPVQPCAHALELQDALVFTQPTPRVRPVRGIISSFLSHPTLRQQHSAPTLSFCQKFLLHAIDFPLMSVTCCKCQSILILN